MEFQWKRVLYCNVCCMSVVLLYTHPICKKCMDQQVKMQCEPSSNILDFRAASDWWTRIKVTVPSNIDFPKHHRPRRTRQAEWAQHGSRIGGQRLEQVNVRTQYWECGNSTGGRIEASQMAVGYGCFLRRRASRLHKPSKIILPPRMYRCSSNKVRTYLGTGSIS